MVKNRIFLLCQNNQFLGKNFKMFLISTTHALFNFNPLADDENNPFLILASFFFLFCLSHYDTHTQTRQSLFSWTIVPSPCLKKLISFQWKSNDAEGWKTFFALSVSVKFAEFKSESTTSLIIFRSLPNASYVLLVPFPLACLLFFPLTR